MSPQLASVYAFGEEDALAAYGKGIYSSEYSPTFNATSLGNLENITQDAIPGSPLSKDSDGNPQVSIPVSLTVHGGTAEFRGIRIGYNYTRTLNVTSWIHSEIPSNHSRGGIENYTLEGVSARAGIVHFSLQVTFYVPVPPTPPSLPSQVSTFFSKYSLDMVLVLVVSGAALAGLGLARYHSRARSPAPPKPKTAPPAPSNDRK